MQSSVDDRQIDLLSVGITTDTPPIDTPLFSHVENAFHFEVKMLRRGGWNDDLIFSPTIFLYFRFLIEI